MYGSFHLNFMILFTILTLFCGRLITILHIERWQYTNVINLQNWARYLLSTQIFITVFHWLIKNIKTQKAIFPLLDFNKHDDIENNSFLFLFQNNYQRHDYKLADNITTFQWNSRFLCISSWGVYLIDFLADTNLIRDTIHTLHTNWLSLSIYAAQNMF